MVSAHLYVMVVEPPLPTAVRSNPGRYFCMFSHTAPTIPSTIITHEIPMAIEEIGERRIKPRSIPIIPKPTVAKETFAKVVNRFEIPSPPMPPEVQASVEIPFEFAQKKLVTTEIRDVSTTIKRPKSAIESALPPSSTIRRG